jgi:hypothetical protein
MDIKAKLKDETTVITGMVRFSYAHVFKPAEFETDKANGKDPKYMVTLLIDKTDKDTVKAIKAAMANAEKAGISSKWGGKKPPATKFWIPLRDGDEERPDDEVYAGNYFIQAKSARKPTVVGKYRGTDGKLLELTTEDEFYSGCYGRASIAIFPYNQDGGVGLGVYLNNVQKLKEGDKLTGGTDANDDFDDEFEDDEDDDLGY